MAFQATPRGIEVACKFTQNGVPIVNVFNIDAGHAVTITDLQDVAGVFATWWDTVAYLYFHSSLLFDEFVVKDISVENGQQVVVSGPTHTAGNQGGDAAGANVALCTTWKTDFTGRSFRGRTYWGGLPQAYLQTAQVFTSSALTNIGAVAAGLKDLLEDAGYTLSVLSRYANLLQRVLGLLTQITTIVLDNKVDSQRRRTAN